jgi:hypothetical protein
MPEAEQNYGAHAWLLNQHALLHAISHAAEVHQHELCMAKWRPN